MKRCIIPVSGSLKKAFDKSGIEENPEYQEFVKENAFWLEDYSYTWPLRIPLEEPAS